MDMNHPYLSDVEWLLYEELSLRQYCPDCEERHAEVEQYLAELSRQSMPDADA